VVRELGKYEDLEFHEVVIGPGPNAFGEIIHVVEVNMREFSRASALAAAQLKLFGLHLNARNPRYGRRRHGQIKHIRDLKRQFAKIEARR
jgi:hypothetical protein